MKPARLPNQFNHLVTLVGLTALMLMFPCEVTAMAPPPDEARTAGGRAKASPSETSRSFIGSSAAGESVIAGTPPTAILKVVPVPAKVGSYPGGTIIVGNELTAFTGGFRAWFEFKISDWDPNGDDDPPLNIWEIDIDNTGFLGANADPSNPGVNLALAVVPCTENAQCATAYGEAWAVCEAGTGTCKSAYVDVLGTGRPDSWCADMGFGACSQGVCDTASAFAPRCFSLLPSGVSRPDEGIGYYGATLVLDIPPTAQGKYTVNVAQDASFLADSAAPPNEIPVLSEIGFVVNVLPPSVQACCDGIGGCSDMLSTDCALAGHTPQGAGTDCSTTFCGPPAGACCNRVSFTCTDALLEANCPPPLEWTASTLCADLPMPCAMTGACCDSSPGAGGSCVDDQIEADCTGANRTWTASTTCAEVNCAEVVGACCDVTPGGGGACADAVLQTQCTGPQVQWYQGELCSNVVCLEATGSCCNTNTFACSDFVTQSNCVGASLLWRENTTCDSCSSLPQILLTPVPAKVGSYPPDTMIIGQEIILPAESGPVRIWVEASVRSWDLDGDGNPPLRAWQFGVDGSGFLGVNATPPNPGVDLTPANVACATNAECAAAFGESWANCDGVSGTCKTAYFDGTGTGRPDSWCKDIGLGPCAQSGCDTLTLASPRCFGLTPSGVPRPDAGLNYYGATLVLDLPANAQGIYTVDLNPNETFLADTNNPAFVIPTSLLAGFRVSVRPRSILPDSASTGSRSLALTAPAPVVATGSAGQTAIRVDIASLQVPIPSNAPCCPPQDFSAYEFSTCNAVGEGNACGRWLGPPVTIQESQDSIALGSFVASRLQCTPYYTDWTAVGPVAASGPEIIPSSTYQLTAYPASCKGIEESCSHVSAPVLATTRRWGDLVMPWAPPSTSSQPDSIDVVAVLDKFKSLPGSPSKAITQIQPNVIELNVDVGALDSVATIDAFRGLAFPYSGPCPCPSAVSCNAVPCATSGSCSGGLCVKTCSGGSHADQPCLNDNHCPGGGACPSTGFCRDRCGRCN